MNLISEDTFPGLLFDRVIDVTLMHSEAINVLDIIKAAVPAETIDSLGENPTMDAVVAAKNDILKAAKHAKSLISDLIDLAAQKVSMPGRSLVLTCPRWGPKPNISVQVNMLPGYICYGLRLTIKNFTLQKGLDIRRFNEMRVRVGYRNGAAKEFVCPIFSSYQTKPNPGGEYVFYGLTVGHYGASLFSPHSYKLVFLRKTLTLEELLTSIKDQMEGQVTFAWDIIEQENSSILQREVTVANDTYIADNGYALLNWLASFLQAWAKAQDINMHILLMEDTFIISSVENEKGPSAAEAAKAVPVNMVKSVSFTGPIMTVEAPYVPDVFPTKLIKIPMKYYSGDSLPNLDIANILQGGNDLWRVVTMDLSFSTTGSDNTMKLVALPASDYDAGMQGSEAQEVIKQHKKYVEDLRKLVKEDNTIEIRIGEKEPLPANESLPADVGTITLSGITNTTDREVQPLETLSGIVREVVNDVYKKRYFTITDSMLEGATVADFSRRDIWYFAFFPIVAIITYQASKTVTDTRWAVTASNLYNPDSIKEHTMLRIPTNIPELVEGAALGNSQYIQLMEIYATYTSASWWGELGSYVSDAAKWLKYGKKK